MAGRFDYVKYDVRSVELQAHFKETFESACSDIEALPDGRAKSLALTHLEESYMWIGKAIRDDQIVRNGSADSQESRCCS